MKNIKKVLALVLAVVLTLSLAANVFAANSDGESYTKGKITIKNPQTGESYNAYKIFDVTYDLGAADDKYAYTINPEWVADVQAYVGNTAGTDGVYPAFTAKGLTITPVKNTSGLVVYNVVKVVDDPNTTDVNEDIFSAADFAEEMAKKTGTNKTAIPFTDGVAANLDLGYYMVQPTVGTLVSLTTTDNEVVVSDKNEKPVVDKSILEPGKELDCEVEHVHTEECFKDVQTKEDHTTASVGDKVDFELDTKVPDMTGYDPYFFVMNDTLSEGLTFNDDVVITIGTEPEEGSEEGALYKKLVKDTDYSVKLTNNEDGTTNIRIVFNNMKQYWSDVEANDWEGEPIVIKYSATVDEDAVMGTIGNTNTAKIEYSNNPNIKPEYDPDTPPTDKNDPKDPNYKHNDPNYDGDDPIGVSVEDKVTVYTTELDITKIDADTQAAISGAKFKIEGEKLNVSIVNKTIFEESTDGTWYRLKDGTYTEESPDKNGENKTTYAAMPEDFEARTGDETSGYTYNTPGLYYLDGENYVLVTEENAVSLYNENPARTYYKATVWKQSDLYEDTTKTYEKVEVIDKTNAEPDKYEAEGWVDENGKITFGGLAEGTYYITELVAPDGYNLLKDPIKVDVALVAGDAEGTYKFTATINNAENAVSEGETGAISFDVENNKGTELPETGGIGTTIFYILGGILLAGAAVLLITKKRMSSAA